VLLETHSAVYDKYLRYQMVAVVFRGEIAANQHQKLLDCALSRDCATARKVLVDHIQGCVEHALARDTDWVTASSSTRVATTAGISSGARDHRVNRRAERPARKRASSA
jgi:hypothetical protein